MAKTRTASTAKVKVTQDLIINKYMDHVLEHGERPATVYAFCKKNEIEEGEFYQYFGSFEGIREQIWVNLFEHTLKVLSKDKQYPDYANREKMLSFFYTFFEMLTANRSYVLFTLKEDRSSLKNLAQLRPLRLKVREYASSLIEESNEKKSYAISKNPVSIFSEGAWMQLLFLLKYWMDDNSPKFERTDVAIEKSVNVIFDVFDSTPLESLLDFGKFLFKERF
ncbi:MAG: heat-shock protein [Cytophagaceae bacterium]|nr:heat-shock protein [Cytophagaceae bacterium]|tara:strand:- start:7838 stop:8506 length:669 start_codon:yes stop_codon:yes gene_type:complete